MILPTLATLVYILKLITAHGMHGFILCSPRIFFVLFFSIFFNLKHRMLIYDFLFMETKDMLCVELQLHPNPRCFFIFPLIIFICLILGYHHFSSLTIIQSISLLWNLGTISMIVHWYSFLRLNQLALLT